MDSSVLPPPAFFANPLMLGWLAAASAPIVIHLLNRRKFREAPWAAMQYLLAAIKKNSRRVRLEHWLLLAVRTLLIVLVVLAVCRPGIQGGVGALGSVARVHRIIVIDGSFSMSAFMDNGERTYFQQAKTLADRIIDGGRDGDACSLVALGTPSRTIVSTPVSDQAEMKSFVAELPPGHGAGDLTGCLDELDRIVDESQKNHAQFTRREVYFLTDLGKHTWESAAVGGGDALAEFKRRCERLGKRLDASEESDESSASAEREPIVVSIVSVDDGRSPNAAQPENTAVVDWSTDEPYAIVGQPVTLRATIRHFGRSPRNKLAVQMFVDGRQQDAAEIDVQADSTTIVAFNYPKPDDPPLAAGRHVFEVRLAQDRLRLDDRRRIVVETKPQLRVLVVRDAGLTDDQALGLSDLTLALRLKPGATLAAPLVKTEIGPVDILQNDDGRDVKRLSEYDCIMLVNVKRLTSTAARLLHDYVYEGGGLVTWLGDRVDVKSYNEQLAVGALRILPTTLGTVVAEPQYKINPLKYEHPLMREFRDQENVDLLNTPIYRYFRLPLAADSRARRALELVNPQADPLIVTEDIGAGRSVLVSVAPQRSWTTLTVSPGFVPIVQTLVSYAAGGRPSRAARIVGEPIEAAYLLADVGKEVRLTLPPGDSEPSPAPRQPADGAAGKTGANSEPAGAGTKSAARNLATPTDPDFSLVAPAGVPLTLKPRGEFVHWTYAETLLGGLYDTWVPVAKTQSADRTWKRIGRYAVNLDPRESDPQRIPSQRMSDLESAGANIRYLAEFRNLTKPESADTFDPTPRERPIHRWLLLAALATAVGETCLAGRIGRRRR